MTSKRVYDPEPMDKGAFAGSFDPSLHRREDGRSNSMAKMRHAVGAATINAGWLGAVLWL